LNVFEDIRGELRKGRKYIGCAQNLAKGNENAVELFRQRHGDKNMARANFWHTLGCGIIMQSHGLDTSWMPASYAPFMTKVQDEIAEVQDPSRCDWAADSFRLGKSVIAKCEELAEEMKQEQEQRKEEKKQDKGEQGDDSAKQDGKGEQGDDEANEGGQSGDEGDSDDTGNEDGPGAPGDDSTNQEGEQAPGDDEASSGEQDGGQSKHGDMSDKEVDDAAKLSDKVAEDADTDDIMNNNKKHIMEVSQDEADHSGRYMNDAAAQASDTEHTPSKGKADEYEVSKAAVAEQIRGLRGKLTTVIRTRARNVTIHSQRKGKLNSRKLAKAALGSDRVFSKTIEGQKLDTAVSVLIDMSGSMGSCYDGSKSYYAKLTAIALAETFDALNVPFEIIGFNTHSGGYVGRQQRRHRGNIRTGRMAYHMFKGYHERFKSVKTRLESIGGSGSNVDGEAVMFAAKRLAARDEDRKVLIVLSDGMPAGGGLNSQVSARHLTDTIKAVTGAGIEAIGIGVLAPHVAEFYSKRNGAENIVVDNLNDLAPKVYKIMRDKLLGRQSLRRAVA